MSFHESTLLKHGIRSDALWTPRFILRFCKSIPFYLDTRALMKSQYWPREKLTALQEKRVRALVTDAANISFWKAMFRTHRIEPITFSLADLSRLPVTAKQDFIGVSFAHVTDAALSAESHRDRTSGSTGRPFGFLVDNGYVLRMYAICERMLCAAGGSVRYPVISMRARERVGFAFTNHEFFFVRGYNAVRHRLDALVESAERYPDGFILYGFVSPLIELARLVREQGIHLRIRGVIASGEELQPNARDAMQQAFGTPVHTCYTTQELGWLAFACEHNRLHLNEESSYVEIVDADNKPCSPDTEGRIVVTAFDQRVMPFIRYYTGDLGVLSTKPCPCGRTLKTITLKGRVAQMIRVGEKREIPLIELASVFDGAFESVRQYQIIQTDSSSFTISIVPGATFTDKKKNFLEQQLVRRLHPDVAITWNIVEEIPGAASSKAIYFVRA